MISATELRNQAIAEEQLKRSLSQHAYSYLKEGETFLSTKKKLVELNSNTDTPLENDELNEIIKTAETNRKTKKTKKDDDNNIYISYLESSDYILEQCVSADLATHAVHADATFFSVFNKSTSVVEQKNEITISGRTYKPIDEEIVYQGGVKFPTGVEEYGSTKELIIEIDTFLSKYFEVNTFFKKFIPFLILFYWVYDKFPFIPYLHFVGLTGTGKTTAQEVVGSICYKPTDASGSLSLSPIFRMASKWGGTLLLDEFEPEGESYREMLAFLKGTVSDKIILKTEGDNKREVIGYLAKCPKIFTSENPINNAGLQSRTIVIKMEKNKIRKPLYRLGRFNKEAQHLRNKLLLWRFHHLSKINLDDIEYGFPELQGFDGRVQQVITPIYYFSDEDTRKEIVEFAKIQEEETKRERRESLEGQVFQCIFDQYPTETTLTAIAIQINKERTGRKPISEKKVGNLVRGVLGFDIQKMGHEKVSTVVTAGRDEKIQELSDYFAYSNTSTASTAKAANGHAEPGEAPETAVHPQNDYQADLYNVPQEETLDES